MSENQSVKERIKSFAKYKDISIRQFESACGFSYGFVGNMRNSMQPDKILRIAHCFPELNTGWLMTGEGQMLKEKVNNEQNLSGEEDSDYVPLLPIEAMAGSLQGLSESITLRDCRKVKAPVKGADWAIQISGDSMEPEYRNGSYLYIRKITGSFLPWGHTLVVDTLDGVVVKDIYPVEGTEDYIEAKSKNPKYPPFRIEKSIIVGFYRVLGGSFINSTI